MTPPKKVLIFFIKFANVIGGGEYLPLLLASELQKRGCHVTIAVDYDTQVAHAAELYDIPLDMCSLEVKQLKPSGRLKRKIDSILPIFKIRRLKRLARDVDVCISTLNLIDFGRPGLHFICDIQYGQFGDTAFCDYANHKSPGRSLGRVYRVLRYWFAENILRALFNIRSPRKIALDKRERIYPNSVYVERLMHNFYGDINSSLFYPPTTFTCRTDVGGRDPYRLVFIGRIHPLKGVVEIIEATEKARQSTGVDVKLHIAGPLESTAYVAKVKTLASSREWVRLVGGLYGKDKEAFLSSGAYAIHVQRDEAFGISVTEYLKAGNIVLVPNDGGSTEIVDSPSLTYHTNDEAARILSHLITDESFRSEMKQHCAERARMFSCEAYMTRQHKLIDEILGEK